MVQSVDYKTKDKVNQSNLKKILIHPQVYKNSVEKFDDLPNTPALIIGSAVDCILTRGRAEFKEKFIVFDQSAVSDKIALILNNLCNRVKDDSPHLELKHLSEELYEEAVNADYNKLWKKETVIRKLLDEGSYYYEFIKSAQDKVILSINDSLLIEDIVDSFKTNEFTKSYFQPSDNQYEYLTQLEIDWEREVDNYLYQCKSALDLVIIDHENKVIIPCDIKTCSCATTEWIQNNYYAYRYDFQATFYTLALAYWIENVRPDLKAYDLTPFRFIVESTKYVGSPLVYKVVNQLSALHDEEVIVNNKFYKLGSVDTAFRKLRWHTDNNIWDYTMEDYLNNGLIEIP